MKIFWSWQSDIDGKIGRHLIRRALHSAIEELRVDEEIDEAIRETMHSDQDRQDVPGSPDLANTILEKIDAAAVFVGDVTLVGATPAGKKLINSNVAIELGYALRAIGDRRLLMVLNLEYGSIEELPFDLRHKAGPITFQLAEGANKSTRDRVEKELSDQFKVRLRYYAKPQGEPIAPPPELYEPATAFFRLNETIARDGVGDAEIIFQYQAETSFALRIFPEFKPATQLRNAFLKEIAQRAPTLSLSWGDKTLVNQHGAILLALSAKEPQDEVRAATQFFRSGEIWAVSRRYRMSSRDGTPVIPTLSFEQAYYEVFRKYVSIAVNELGVQLPLIVEFSADGLDGLFIGMAEMYWESKWGPVRSNSVRVRRRLSDLTDDAINAALLDFFDEIFDAAGHARPPGLHNFPPHKPGTIL